MMITIIRIKVIMIMVIIDDDKEWKRNKENKQILREYPFSMTDRTNKDFCNYMLNLLADLTLLSFIIINIIYHYQ